MISQTHRYSDTTTPFLPESTIVTIHVMYLVVGSVWGLLFV